MKLKIQFKKLKKMGKVTSIIIAHRKTTIVDADKVFVIKDGSPLRGHTMN